MKAMLGLVALVGLAAGGVGVVVGGVLSSTQSATDVPVAVSPNAGVEGELARLSERLEVLADRMLVLESRPVTSAPTRLAVDTGTEPAEAELQAELRDLVAALKTDEGELPQSFHATVSKALQDIRDDEERQRDEERQARQMERIEERVAELTTELGLGTTQATQLRDLFVDLDLQRDQIRDRMRDGDWNQMRETFGELREKSDTRLKAILSPDQYDKYQETNRDEFGGRGGFGGGGGFGGRRGGD